MVLASATVVGVVDEIVLIRVGGNKCYKVLMVVGLVVAVAVAWVMKW